MTIPKRELMAEIIMSWPPLAELAEFAAARHGFSNSDIGHGVTYPEDLDDGDREMGGIEIPPGYILMYAGFDDEEFVVPETQYLAILAERLKQQGLHAEGRQVESLIARLSLNSMR